MPCLHAQKPLDVVVIALGTNDLKVQFSNTANSIAAGIQILARDVERATAIGRAPSNLDPFGQNLDGHRPEIIILGPPLIKETAASVQWGFVGAEQVYSDQMQFTCAQSSNVETHTQLLMDIVRLAKISSLCSPT
jgi:hypothetical protein